MKYLTWVLVFVFILSALAGCGGTGKTAAPADKSAAEASAEVAAESNVPAESEEAPAEALVYPLSDGTATLSLWTPDQSTPNTALPVSGDMNAYAFWDYVEQQTGVKLDLTVVSMTAETEQMSLLIASGDYTDIMALNASMVSGGMSRLLTDDVIVDLAPYVDANMPNYSAYINKDETIKKLNYDDDGFMYGIRTFAEYYVPNSGFIIRKDLVEALGMELPTTITGLHDVLTAMKSEYGMSSPIWMGTSGQLGTGIVGAMGTPGFAQDFGSVSDHLFIKDGKVASSLTDDNYLAYLKLMNQWYGEGLFLPDFYTQTEMDLDRQSMLGGNTGVMSTMYGGALTTQNLLSAQDEKAQICGLPSPTTDAGEADSFHTFSPLSNASYKCISTDCADVALALRYIDWWYTEDGYLTGNYGVKGLSYDVDANGKPYYTDAVTKNEWDVDPASAIEAFVTTNPVFGLISMDRSVYLAGGEWVNEMLNTWVAQCSDAGRLPDGIILTAQESEEVSSLCSDIATYASESIDRFIIGDYDFSKWSEFTATVQEQGLQTILDIYQGAYERYLAR